MRFLVSIILIIITVIAVGCTAPDLDKYQQVVKKEMSKDVQQNDIFFGISFGMTSKNFYTHCWNMNKKGLFTDGATNTSVLYKLKKNELKFPASMNFYPQFKDGKIHKMQVTYHYDGWAPWNRHLGSDSLLQDILQFYKKWYPGGQPFMQLNDKAKGIIYVKVDGNRRITIGKFDDMHVKADYTDLNIDNKLEN